MESRAGRRFCEITRDWCTENCRLLGHMCKRRSPKLPEGVPAIARPDGLPNPNAPVPGKVVVRPEDDPDRP